MAESEIGGGGEATTTIRSSKRVTPILMTPSTNSRAELERKTDPPFASTFVQKHKVGSYYAHCYRRPPDATCRPIKYFTPPSKIKNKRKEDADAAGLIALLGDRVPSVPHSPATSPASRSPVERGAHKASGVSAFGQARAAPSCRDNGGEVDPRAPQVPA